MHKMLDPYKEYMKSFCLLKGNLKVTMGFLVYNFEVERCLRVCVCVDTQTLKNLHISAH